MRTRETVFFVVWGGLFYLLFTVYAGLPPMAAEASAGILVWAVNYLDGRDPCPQCDEGRLELMSEWDGEEQYLCEFCGYGEEFRI